MATVPGDPNDTGPDPYGGIPPGLRPGYPELLMAAAIHKQQQDQKLAGDVVKGPWTVEKQKSMMEETAPPELLGFTPEGLKKRGLGNQPPAGKVLPMTSALGQRLAMQFEVLDPEAAVQKTAGGDDYDFTAAKAAGVKPDARGHWPDTFKKPNHITFSDESKFDDGGAGHWEHLGGKRWSFTPGPTNLKYHSMDEMRAYFKKYEPDSVLLEPER